MVAILIHWAKTMHTNNFRIHKLNFTIDYPAVKFVGEDALKMLFCLEMTPNLHFIHQA